MPATAGLPRLLPPRQAGGPDDPPPGRVARARGDRRAGRGPGDPVRFEQDPEAARPEIEQAEAVLDRAAGRDIDPGQHVRYRRTRNQRHRVRVERRCPALAGPGLRVRSGPQAMRPGDQVTPPCVVGRCRLPRAHEPIVPAIPAAGHATAPPRPRSAGTHRPRAADRAARKGPRRQERRNGTSSPRDLPGRRRSRSAFDALNSRHGQRGESCAPRAIHGTRPCW